jgi:hypothetical protein
LAVSGISSGDQVLTAHFVLLHAGAALFTRPSILYNDACPCQGKRGMRFGAGGQTWRSDGAANFGHLRKGVCRKMPKIRGGDVPKKSMD